MAKAKAKKVLLMNDGKEYEITGEAGRFWICGDTQFRKGNGEVVEAKTGKDAAKEDEVEGE